MKDLNEAVHGFQSNKKELLAAYESIVHSYEFVHKYALFSNANILARNKSTKNQERSDSKMAVKVNLKSTTIPVEIGDMKFEVKMDEDNYLNFAKKFEIFLSELEQLDEEKLNDLEYLKPMFRVVHDALLGDGSFDMVYNAMPNLRFVEGTFKQVVVELDREIRSLR